MDDDFFYFVARTDVLLAAPMGARLRRSLAATGYTIVKF
jgi:hypothetical protein